MLNTPTMRRLALTACLATLAGCVGDLVELTPRKDAAPGADLASNGGDGGTRSFHFVPDIQADITSVGCSAVTCHGGTQIPILKDATDAPTLMQNYTNFTSMANMGANSPVLIRNLAGNPTAHSGGKPFQNASDPIYVRWLAWIQAGNPQ